MNKAIALIPARYDSSRFKGKLLADLNGKPVIQHVYANIKKCSCFSKVLIATDSELIEKTARGFGAEVILTSSKHTSGTDRIAEALTKYCDKTGLSFDIAVNVQGDEPFLTGKTLEPLLAAFNSPQVECASLMHKITDPSEITNPNNVKVVTDAQGFSLYFSRSKIPFVRDADTREPDYFKHIGVYAFRVPTLYKFVSLKPTELEKLEKLEQLRLLENGIKIKMVITKYEGIGIDTPQDLAEAELMLAKR